MKKTKLYFLLLIAAVSTSCFDSYDSQRITVLNKSSDTIYSIVSPNDDMLGSGFYEEYSKGDDYIYTKNDSTFMFRFSEIYPGSEVENHDAPRFWKDYFDSATDEKIRVFIVSKDSVNNYGWKKVFKEQLYTKKYKFSKKDLDESQWKVEYP